MRHVAIEARAMRMGQKDQQKCRHRGELWAARQKPVGLMHLDGKLSGQNCPDCVTQAGQEAARSTERRLVLSGFLCTSQIEKPVGTDKGMDETCEFGFPKEVFEKGNCNYVSL